MAKLSRSGALGGSSARADMWPERPWVETDGLEDHLVASGADPEAVSFCRTLADTGISIIDLGVDGRTLCDHAVAETDPYFAEGDVYRVQDAWLKSDAVRALATHPQIVRLLALAYGRKPVPFQTLNFQKGTQQDVHSDAIHFHSEPERFMCGVWIALEDVTQGAGPLDYLPGSHKLPVLTMQAAGVNRGHSGAGRLHQPLPAGPSLASGRRWPFRAPRRC